MSRSSSLAFSHNFLLAGLTLLSGTAAAADAEKLAVQMEWTTLGYHVPFYLAVAKGWFKDAGLDVSITPGSGSNTTVQLVAGGNADVGHAWPGRSGDRHRQFLPHRRYLPAGAQ
jgi:ABC-type nitrate/sulfonate/bicarbonate transport system substrate-binding protein